jgi:class I fructose-bisphosphate aldolase
MAALLGANIIKVKLPSDFLGNKDSKKVYEEKKIPIATQADRVKHIMQCAFAGRRLVVFSGGAAKGEDSVIQDARDIHAGGGNGSIIGRNCFQRPREDALKLLDTLIEIYKGK